MTWPFYHPPFLYVHNLLDRVLVAVRIKGKKKFSALSALVHAVDRSPRLCKYLLICMLAPSSFLFAARILLFCVVDDDGLLVRADDAADPCEIVLGELLM